MHGHHGDGARFTRERVEVASERKPLEQRRERLAGKGSIGAVDLIGRLGRGGRNGRRRLRSGNLLCPYGQPSRTELLKALERTLDIVVALLELGRYAQEFLDVLHTAFGLGRPLCTKRLHKAALLHNGLDHALQLTVHAAPLAHNRHEVTERRAHLRGKAPGLGGRDLACLEEAASVLPRELLDLGN